MTTIKRKALSLEDKVKILEAFDEKSRIKSQTQVAADLNLPVSTLRTILKDRKKIEENHRLGVVQRKKQKVGKFDKLEKILVAWFHQARASNLPISGPIICEKACKIAKSLNIDNFTASNGWIDRFKNRHGIVYRQISRNSKTEAQQDVETWIDTLPELLQNYEARNIFTAAEFGLYFKLMPDQYGIKEESCNESKSNKERLTILACANSDGSEKLRLLVIGKTKNPLCFKNVKSLPVTYDTQSGAWMTGTRFINWLKALDNHFQIECRRIVLFIDDCPAHPKDVELKNIKIVYLPPNVKSKLHPMDQGIIKVLKQVYRTRLVHRYFQEIEDPDSKQPLTVHDAILNIAAAWEAVRPETIQYCFKKAGFSNDVALEEPIVLQSFPGYSSIDDNVAPYEISSSEEFIENVKHTQKDNDEEEALSDNDEDDELIPILSDSQALSAINELRRFVTTLNQSEDALQKLNYVENFILNKAKLSDQHK